MKKTSVNALLGGSLLFFLSGIAIISPDGRLFCLAVTGIMAAFALAGAKTRLQRIAALVILLAAIGFAIPTFSEYRIQCERYRSKHSRFVPPVHSIPRMFTRAPDPNRAVFSK